MSTSGDDDRFGGVPEGLGLEETSQGAESLGDLVEGRPVMPELGSPDFSLPMNLSNSIVLDAEHLFGSSPLFDGLSPEEIREIVGAAKKQPLEAGDLLFEQGAEASALYIIQSGEVQVRAADRMGEDIVLAILGSSTIVGELALIDGGPRSATVEALSDCDVYCLTREAFEELRGRRRPAAYKVIMGLASTVDARRRQTEARINEVFEDPAQHIDLFESQVHEMLARLRKV